MLSLYWVANVFRTPPSFVRPEDKNILLLRGGKCDLEPGICMQRCDIN